MHGDNGPGARRNRGLDQPFIQIERILPDIDEHRNRAAQDKSVCSRHKGVGRQDNFVATFDVQQQRCQIQRRRTGVR